MSSREPLEVMLYGTHVADLVDAGFGDTAIRHTPAALAAPEVSRLSLALPPRPEMYPASGPGGRWVRSLLPEGPALSWAVSTFGVPENDRFGLIALLGRDVAGAVEIRITGVADTREPHYQVVTDAEAAEHVRRAPEASLGLDRIKGIRLSLAGVQDKVLLHRIGNSWALPIDGAPSTIIIKPEPTAARSDGLSFVGLATNELYCLTLARRCGLAAANARVERFDATRALVVERYDRVTAADGSVQRVHQEDLLGALGLEPLLKYEVPHVERLAVTGGWGEQAARVARPGPSLADLSGMLATHLGSANLLPFFRAVAFNVLIGNADAHARNYSLLLAPDGAVALAPLYDLVCTRYFAGLDTDAAQKINGQHDIDLVTGEDLVSEASGWRIPSRIAAAHLQRLIHGVIANAEPAIGDCVQLGGDLDVATQVSELVRARSKTILIGHKSRGT